ncbi:MAG: hypothetical protein JXQ27_06325 [Acidobacteria bacterium]|nr:hypothetical protein [Acidobacteriota bacterium]
MDQNWQPLIEDLEQRNIRFIEVLHVDGRRLKGEVIGLGQGPAGFPQLIMKDTLNREIRLYFEAIRHIHY